MLPSLPASQTTSFRDPPLLINDFDSSMHAICARALCPLGDVIRMAQLDSQVVADYKCTRIYGEERNGVMEARVRNTDCTDRHRR